LLGTHLPDVTSKKSVVLNTKMIVAQSVVLSADTCDVDKGKIHPCTGPEDSMSLRLPDFRTVGT
jgi:hypothetical protein